MSDENKTETVQEEVKQEEVVEQVEAKEPKEDSQALIDKTIKDRLHRQKRRTLEDLGVSDIDEAKEIIARSILLNEIFIRSIWVIAIFLFL